MQLLANPPIRWCPNTCEGECASLKSSHKPFQVPSEGTSVFNLVLSPETICLSVRMHASAKYRIGNKRIVSCLPRLHHRIPEINQLKLLVHITLLALVHNR